MKRIKLLFPALCITLVLLCCGCGLFIAQKFTCDVEEVQKIEIATYDGYNKEEQRFEYTILAEVSDHFYFVNQLESIKNSVVLGEPPVITEGYTIIRIEYLNGDFDLIHSAAQIKKRNDKTNTGYLIFDKKQFDSLISEYVKDEQ